MITTSDLEARQALADFTYIPPEIGSRLARASLRVAELEATLSRQQKILNESQAALDSIHASRGWRLLSRYYRIRNKLLPPDTVRRALVGYLVRLVKRVRPGKKKTLASVSSPMATPPSYARWIERFEPKAEALAQQRVARLTYEPRISILVAMDNTPAPFMPALLRSIREQTYQNWELCLAGGRSPQALTRDIWDAGLDALRCKTIPLDPGNTMSDAHNAALAASTGEYVVVLSAHDVLAPFALFEIVQRINWEPAADFLYSDEDRTNEAGDERSDPIFKPEWSPDTLRSHNYIGRLAIFSRVLLERIGGFRADLASADHYDLILRASEQAGSIARIPWILCHRYADAQRFDGAGTVHKKALQEHLDRLGIVGEVRDGLRPGTYQACYLAPDHPLISIIIPNKDRADMLAGCIESLARSSYDRYEVLIMENASQQPETFAYYQTLTTRKNTRVIRWDRAFNYSALNNDAVRQASGDVLLFLNNDIQVINTDWLERMLEHALRPSVGAVGAKLFYPDDTIQHGGVFASKHDGPSHLNRFARGDGAGYGNSLVTVQNFSAVTAACMMTRRQVFQEVGGFDEAFVVAFNDVDLCLKMRQKGYHIVWTPYAQLYHFESVSRGYEPAGDKEIFLFKNKWRDFLKDYDPFLSPHVKGDGPECIILS